MKFKNKQFKPKIGKIGYNFVKESEGGLVRNVAKGITRKRR